MYFTLVLSASNAKQSMLMECAWCVLQDETEYETDSEDEVYGQQLLKPVFVPKADREVGVPGPGSHIMPAKARCWL